MRQLYIACVASVSDFGAPVWYKGQEFALKQLGALQNLAMRKILGVFKTAPIPALELEAALPPPEIRLNRLLRAYAVRTLRLNKQHPIRKLVVHNEDDDDDRFLDHIPAVEVKGRFPTQLERIRASIKDLTLGRKIEVIHPSEHKPWERGLPFQVSISAANKDQAALEHHALLQSIQTQEPLCLYSDGSKGEDGSIGVGLAAYDYTNSPPTLITRMANIGSEQEVYDGELEGIEKALLFAERSNHQGPIHVFSDSKAALERLTSFHLAPGQAAQTRIISAARRMLRQEPDMKIRLHWVPEHSNVEGNEKADQAAKQATKLACHAPRSSLSFLKRMVNERKSSEWQKHVENLRTRPTTYSQSVGGRLKPRRFLPKISAPRKTISAFHQLKIGHGYFKSYLKRFAKQESDRCSCGNRQTPSHLLLECKTYNAQRKSLRDKLSGLRLSMPLLLNTKRGLIPTLDFLKETGICTRKWMMESSD